MQLSRTIPKIVISVLAIILIAGAFYFSKSGEPVGTKEYSSPLLGFELEYPARYTLVETPAADGSDSFQPIILRFYSRDGRIVLVPSNFPATTTAKERTYYDENLFKGTAQAQNSRIERGEFTGYKSINGFEGSFITLYRTRNADSSFVLRGELVASSSDALLGLESDFLSITDSVVLK